MLTFRKGVDKLAWCHAIAFFEFPVEVGKLLKPAVMAASVMENSCCSKRSEPFAGAGS